MTATKTSNRIRNVAKAAKAPTTPTIVEAAKVAPPAMDEKAIDKAYRAALKSAETEVMADATIAARMFDKADTIAEEGHSTLMLAVQRLGNNATFTGCTPDLFDAHGVSGLIRKAVAVAYAKSTDGVRKVRRAQCKAFFLCGANKVQLTGNTINKRYEEAVAALKETFPAPAGAKSKGGRPPRQKGSGKATATVASKQGDATAPQQVKTWDRAAAEHMMAFSPIGDYAAMLVDMCVNEPAKVKAWLDTQAE